MVSAIPLISSVLFLAPSVFSIPMNIVGRAASNSACKSGNLTTAACPTSKLSMNLPTNQTTLTAPASPEQVNWVAVGTGYQNYTCNNGVYASIGAVASLFDASCLANSAIFPDLPYLAYLLPVPDPTIPAQKRGFAPTADQLAQLSAAKIPVSSLSAAANALVSSDKIGNHYFVQFNNTLSPKFDFTPGSGTPQSKLNVAPSTEYVILAKQASLASQSNSTANVAWLKLGAVSGTLSDFVYRVNTVGGQPPASCTGSDTTSVKYAALYYGWKASS